ncbi:MAG: hypothetical protein Q7K42_04710 [Candidatus Diapherotrites archaeon]|nr:hypothetical protein [Candidatus Diapherotrites archaeon]
MIQTGETKIVVITGGLNSEKDSEILRATQLKNVLFKNHSATIVKIADQHEFQGNAIVLVEHKLDESTWKKDIAKKHAEHFAERKLNHAEIIQEIKHQIEEIILLRNPEFLLLEINNDIYDNKNLDLVEAIKELENELGRQKFLFVHIAQTPEIGQQDQHAKSMEKNQGKLFLDVTGIKPNVIIEGHEIKWLE